MDDYELENARQWDDDLPPPILKPREPSNSARQLVDTSTKPAQRKEPLAQAPLPSRARRPRPPPQQRQKHTIREQHPTGTAHAPPPSAAALAETAWRERQPPAATLPIPDALAFVDKSFEKLAADNGAFVTFSSDHKAFGIWGEVPNVAAAKTAILRWKAAATSSRSKYDSLKFPKIVSLTVPLRGRYEKQYLKEIQRSGYRQDPPTNMAFGAIGWFYWPVDEYRPQAAFGMSCEALDPIRMEHECYIKFDDRRSSFQVCGKHADVQKVLLALRRTCYQLASDTIKAAPIRAYLPHWRSGVVPSHVYLEEYDDIACSPRGLGELDDTDRIQLERTQSTLSERRLSLQIENALRKLHYHRGGLELRMRLGTFILKEYQAPEDDLYEVQEFVDMISLSGVRALVTHEFGDKSKEKNMLRHLQQANGLLCPLAAQMDDLADVRPSYSVVFLFEHDKSYVRLKMTWNVTENLDGKSVEFAEPMKEWSKLEHDRDRNTGRQTKLLDGSLVDLQTGLAWAFELETSDVIENARVDPALQAFSKTVTIDPWIAANPRMSQKPFVAFRSLPPPREMRQSITWSFAIQRTDYTLELTQFQDRKYQPRSSVREKMPDIVCEPRWGLSVSRMHWETMFGENRRMAVGNSANWSHEMEEWFPKDWVVDQRDGFDQFVDKLVKVERMVKEISTDDSEGDNDEA